MFRAAGVPSYATVRRLTDDGLDAVGVVGVVERVERAAEAGCGVVGVVERVERAAEAAPCRREVPAVGRSIVASHFRRNTGVIGCNTRASSASRKLLKWSENFLTKGRIAGRAGGPSSLSISVERGWPPPKHGSFGTPESIPETASRSVPSFWQC